MDTLTVTEVAKALRTSKAQVYQYMHREERPLVFWRPKKGARWLIFKKDFMAWVRENETSIERA